MLSLQRRLAREDGLIAIFFALSLVILLGVTAFVVDLGRTRHAKQQLQDAIDSASIAAAAYLPVNDQAGADTVKSWAVKLTVASTSGLAPAAVNTSFVCVLRYPDNTPGGAMPDLGNDAGSACGPGPGLTWSGGWTTKAEPPPPAGSGKGKTSHACNPYPPVFDLCNAVKVQTSQTLNYLFAPVLGVNSGSTGAVQSVACKGLCKPTGNPLDVAVVLDRTGSMTQVDIDNLKAAANALLLTYNPNQQSVALFALPYGRPANTCLVQSPQLYPDLTATDWLLTPGFSTDYQVPGSRPPALNPLSNIVKSIGCIIRTGPNPSPSPVVKVMDAQGNYNQVGGGHTNLGDPIAAAEVYLRTNGRPTVPDVIIFMTDGEANQPNGLQPCDYAAKKAAVAKASTRTGGAAQVYTIGYGVAAAQCQLDTQPPYAGVFASTLLANMASSTIAGLPSTDNLPGDCAADENTDGDNYFCEDKSGNLDQVFQQVAQQSAKNARLIDVD